VNAKTHVFNILDFQGTQTNSNIITKAFHTVIEVAAKQGGGIIEIPPGIYLCGTIPLKSNIQIEFLPGAILQYNPDEDDFWDGETLDYDPHADFETSYFHFSMFLLEGIENVTIQGPGEIQNTHFPRGGPKAIAVKKSKRVTVRDIKITNAPNYCVSLMDSEQVTIDNIIIENGIADGIDLDNSRFIRISNCLIDSFDDGICLKTSPALGVIKHTENITVTNCIIASSCNAFKFGTESNGDFKHIVFSNSVINPRVNARPAMAGIALESVDGSHIENVTINNIAIHGANCPIFLRLGYRGRANNPSEPGTLEQVIISNITATNLTFPIVISGIPTHSIRHIVFHNLQLRFSHELSTPRGPKEGELVPERYRALETSESLFGIPERIASYPESEMFGDIPCWGLYAHHVEDLHIHNIHLEQIGKSEDHHKPIVIIGDSIQGFFLNNLHILNFPISIPKNYEYGTELVRIHNGINFNMNEVHAKTIFHGLLKED
jgi:hypothetical protein